MVVAAVAVVSWYIRCLQMAERILCPPQDRSNVDNLIDNNFRKAMTVSIMTIFGVEE